MAALAAAPDAASIASNACADLDQGRLAVRVRRVSGRGEHVRHRGRDVGRPVVGAAEGVAVGAGHAEHRRRDPGPADADGALVGLGERAAGQEDGRDRQLVGRERGQVVGEDRRLLGRLRRRRDAIGHLAPAAHGRDGIRCAGCSTGAGSRTESTARGRAQAAHPRQPAGLPALVPGSRGRAPDALPGRPDAPRRDRALLHDARARAGHPGDGDPRPRRRGASSGRAPSASWTRTTDRSCSTSRSASTTPGATATAARRRR